MAKKTQPAQRRSLWIMTRRGTFRPHAMYTNQCKEAGWMEYRYTMRMVFDGRVSLNEQDFIIDHDHVHGAVAGHSPAGSCERMAIYIISRVRQLMEDNKIPMLACKLTIQPVVANEVAQLEQVFIEEDAPADIGSYLA